MDTASGPGTTARATELMNLVYLAACLAGVLYTLWLTLPLEQRTQANIALRRKLSHLMSATARRTAAASMRREIQTGGKVQDYDLSYWLAVQADRQQAKINLIRQGLA